MPENQFTESSNFGSSPFSDKEKFQKHRILASASAPIQIGASKLTRRHNSLCLRISRGVRTPPGRCSDG